jgi:autotransporter passenger strand-loop-strand repeat protein
VSFTVGSSASTSVDSTITVDVAPNAPVISSLVNTTGTPGSQITDHAQVEVYGTADPGTTVQIFADGGTTAIGVGTTSSGGTFDIVTSALSDGSHSLTATATDPAQVAGASSAVFSVTVDADAGEQNAFGVTVNGGNPIAAAIATAVPFSGAGIEADDSGTVIFSDGVNPPVVVTITNGQVAPTANLSGLNDGSIKVTLHLNSDAAGNGFTDIVTSITLYAVIVSSGALTISGGQTSGNILVLSGATLDIPSGGTAIDPVVSSGGSLVVDSGGFADPTIIYSGASETISASATDLGAIISGGTQLDYGFASGVTIFTGSQVVEGGGTASGTTISGGLEIVSAAGGRFRRTDLRRRAGRLWRRDQCHRLRRRGRRPDRRLRRHDKRLEDPRPPGGILRRDRSRRTDQRRRAGPPRPR